MRQLIEITNDFQSERPGLKENNDVYTSIRRAEVELLEVWQEYYIGTTEELKKELIDVALFISAALVALGVTQEEASNLVTEKHHLNQHRYDPDHFAYVNSMVGGRVYTVEDALSRSRHHDKIGAGQPNDVY
jgi:hypothetical protein